MCFPKCTNMLPHSSTHRIFLLILPKDCEISLPSFRRIFVSIHIGGFRVFGEISIWTKVRENKERNSMKFVYITFAQYCIYLYLHKLYHLRQILVYNYNCMNLRCCYNQRSRHKDWNPQSTHRYLNVIEQGNIIGHTILCTSYFVFNDNLALYLRKQRHFQWILVYKYSYKNLHCWRNQRSRHTGWNPQNTHRYLI